eukprot:gnl/TRDRNA2_/TRDRNA2_123634_c2_seq1.p1 gnl/TRDRNA2_/TRDRNA2_123634_c2~~gnl/TRDRNA2_/TRDRNA2_123634_c2_seq1.p1  ORF type:complete len:301 (-),score=26.89 gnl/TRDRNA2_/TRDRNA2_123634_c2_seq1:19-921(-)
MILYDTGYWNITFAFSLRGSVFPKSFHVAFPCAVLSVLLNFAFQANQKVEDEAWVGGVGATVLQGFSFVLGFLIVFRAQHAYSRWWEGGTLLQQLRGEWFNAFSNLIAFCNSNSAKKTEVCKFQHILVRLMSLLYRSALHQVCTIPHKNFELIEIDGFDLASMQYLLQAHDRCEIVLQWIQKLVVEANSYEVIKIAPPILSRVYHQLGTGIVNLNNARKITDFPIPFPIAQMITVMLMFHWCITPLVCASSIDSPIWTGVLCFVVVFSFWTINYIAVELEMPFGPDANDLPLHDMQPQAT